MRSLLKCLVLTSFLITLGRFAGAQSTQSAAPPAEALTGNATKQKVEQLRQEVAEQRQTIEQLKALVQQLVDAKSQQPLADGAQLANKGQQPPSDGAQVVNATLVQGAGQSAPSAKPAEKKESGPPVTAGWNGEHFFIRSADGKFQLQPYGYAQSDYRIYSGDGAPSNTFAIRRARLGFQGNYGKNYDFALLIDAAASNGLSLRDVYLNIKPVPEFQIQAGQFKEPWAQEEMTAASNLDFIERSLASLLYPSAATAFRKRTRWPRRETTPARTS